ncbi:Kdo hydroxylase family protein [Chitinasiproducens palmae]|uniref:3-deoxy-D-manno-oct-2-ulosonic acid (Kdo) hydroxylase n=1 Tax=Chitinasiproducens palmae TaxID=1770053 RepID=A0A1H2PPH9_9BURK|nr:Kdo hydroxylase family protein [Chitinasiproducens palmae]SDV47806.1 3-deoxy-D-manno-oct-2-ulosonic acid (Kdo) hydroxylase [Chitinasiproducens palmae]
MPEAQIIEVAGDWHGGNLSVPRTQLVASLERGRVLHFPRLEFALADDERALLDPAIADPKRKNISLDAGGKLVGVVGDETRQAAVRALVARYAAQAAGLIDGLLPEYRGRLRAAPTSLRLHRVETRQTSWRKDDSRLHIDAFPSRPNYGERILRVFANVNPLGEPRVWRVGEAFDDVAARFLPRLPRQTPGSAWLLDVLGITKTRRSAYDHLMLALHDAMKADMDYQRDCSQVTMPFLPGSVWVCFSDQASHAVMSGQFMLEQTFFLPAAAMVEPDCSPLRVLERLSGRALV